MTEALVDPQLQAWAASDPSLLEPREVEEPHADHLDAVAVALAAAVIAVMHMVRQNLGEAPPADVAGSARRAWAAHTPLWLRLAVPAIRHAYALGRVEGLTEQEIEKLAVDYAASLGDYLDQTSADALADGFHQVLAQKWSERVAWQRAASAYGLDARSMRGVLTSMNAQNGPDILSDASRKMVDRAILSRADLVGQSEAFRAMQTGRALSWLVRQNAGDIPADALKEWDYRDEAACELCQEMHKQAVPLSDSFQLPDGTKVFASPAHPGCRCHIQLTYPEPIEKSYKDDPYNRQTDGRFAHLEQRHAVALALQPDLAQEIEQIATPKPLSTGSLTGRTLGTPQRGLATPQGLSTRSLDTPKSLSSAPEPTPERRPVYAVLIRKKPVPPPPPKPDGERYVVNGESIWLTKPSYGEITTLASPHGGVPAARYFGPFDSHVRPQMNNISDDEWKQIVTSARRLRNQGLDENRAEEILDNLGGSDLAEIADWAGESYKGHFVDPTLAKSEILKSIHHMGSGNFDDSLAQAYADYVTFNYPELIDPTTGAAFGQDLRDTNFVASVDAVPQNMYVLDRLGPGDSQTDIRGEYYVESMRYRSAIGEFGTGAPVGRIGVREWYLQSFS